MLDEDINLHNIQQAMIYTGGIKASSQTTQQMHHYYPYNYIEH